MESEINLNDSDEKPVEFYKEKDLFGFSKSGVEHEVSHSRLTKTEIKPDEADTVVTSNKPYSEYQSIKHFCILCLLSLGIYPVFWFYKHWRFLRDEKKLDIKPLWRASFILFYGYSLFSKFNTLATEYGYKQKYPLIGLFILFVLATLLVYIEGYLVIVSLFAFIFLIPVLNMINFYYLKEQPNHSINKKLTVDEKIFLAVIWGFLLLKMFD
jgi:hypothetical protein